MNIDSILEVREYWAACDKLFVQPSVVDYGTEAYERKRIAEIDYHGAWKRLLEAGYTPEEAFRLRKGGA